MKRVSLHFLLFNNFLCRFHSGRESGGGEARAQ
jgi:hypothetical protein